MSPTPEQIAEGVALGKTAAEAALPVLIPFDPLITVVASIIMAHFNATKTWPSEDEIRAAFPVDYKKFVDGWASWKPSGDGTLPTTGG